MTLYFVGACIRLYPFAWMSRQKTIVCALVGSILVVSGAIVLKTVSPGLFAGLLGRVCSVHESSALFAFVIGTGVFLFFKNLNLAYRPWVNKIASCMFGVLCIHAALDAMRHWLWQEVCRVPGMATAQICLLALHAFLCVLSIMTVCSLIDMARQKWIEAHLLNWFFEANEWHKW